MIKIYSLILPLILQWTVPLHVPATSAAPVGGMAVVTTTNCSSAGGSGGSGSFNCTIPSTTGGNALLYACATIGGATVTVPTPASSALMTHGDAGGGVTDLSLAASANITGGITNVNVQGTNSFAEVDCVIAEVSGLPTSIVTDQTTNVTASGFGTGSATNFTGPVTTTHALDTILGYMGGGAGTPSVGSGYTVVGSLVGTNYTVGLEFRNVASTATYNPGYTYSNPNFIVIDTTAVER